MNERILVVDDDVNLSLMIATSLRRKGYQVLSATHGLEALKLAYEHRPDLVVLDVMMPEIDGWQTCQRLRQMCDVPIIFLTAKGDEQDVVRGLELGADDYIRKPFSLRELELRVCAILRRASQEQASSTPPYEDGDLRIDIERQHVFRNGQMVHLTPTEFRLLRALVCRQGSVATHQELLAEVWGEGYLEATNCLSLYIRYLREKLEEDPGEPQYIHTQWGRGYWFGAANGIA